MYKILASCLLGLISFSSFAFHPEPNPETRISNDSMCASFSNIFNRSMKFYAGNDAPSRDMPVVLAIVSGKIHTIRVGHKNTIIGQQDTTNTPIPGMPTFNFYRSRLNVQAMISMTNEPDTYYGVRLLDESPCSLNEFGRFNLLQTAYENDLSVKLKVAKIGPFRAPIDQNDEGFVMQDFDLKYGYILDVEVTSPAPPPAVTVPDMLIVTDSRATMVIASAAVGLVLGAGLVGFARRRG